MPHVSHNVGNTSYFKRFLYHLIPQADYVYDANYDTCLIDQVLLYEKDYERVRDELRTRGYNVDLKFENPDSLDIGSYLSKNSRYFTQPAIKLVNEIYARDFELFDYDIHNP